MGPEVTLLSRVNSPSFPLGIPWPSILRPQAKDLTTLPLRAGAPKGQKLPHQGVPMGPGGSGRERKLSGKVKAWQRPLGGLGWGQDSRPPPLSVTVGPGQGRGERHSPVLGSHSSRSSSSLGTQPRPPGGHLCSGGREEGGGNEEDSRAGQQAPQPPPELWDRIGGGPWAETPGLHPSSLIVCWVTQGPSPPHAK